MSARRLKEPDSQEVYEILARGLNHVREAIAQWSGASEKLQARARYHDGIRRMRLVASIEILSSALAKAARLSVIGEAMADDIAKELEHVEAANEHAARGSR